jgi:GLPGLI family protein
MKAQTNFLIVFLFSAILFAGYGKTEAKEFSGVIVYNITYGDDVDAQTAAMMPKTMKIIIKGNKSRMEMSMGGMGTTVVIFDADKKDAITLMDMMGQKYAMTMTTEEIEAQNTDVPDVDVDVTGETKEIAGYKCKKAIIKEKGDSGREHIVYFTDELGSGALNYNNPTYKNIDGVMLEYSSAEEGMSMKFSAIKVEKKKVSDKDFEIPEGYKVMTMDEFKNMFGG